MTELPSAAVDRLVELGHVRALRRGERLIHEGSSTGAVVLVLEGTVRVTRVLRGNEIILAIRGPGDLLGELGPITGGGAVASVEARESGRVVVVPSSRFLEAQRDHPEIATAVVARLVEMLAESDRRLVDAQCKPLAGRIAKELSDLARLAGSGAPRDAGTVTVTQAELASLCVTSRSSVAETLAHLRSSGLIWTRRGRVTILDPDGLHRLADDDHPGSDQSGRPS